MDKTALVISLVALVISLVGLLAVPQVALDENVCYSKLEISQAAGDYRTLPLPCVSTAFGD